MSLEFSNEFLIQPKGDEGGATINNQNKTFIENGTYQADSGYTGLGTVTVDVKKISYTNPDGYLIRVIDYDGIVLKEDRLNAGSTFTLPNSPTHTGLVFQEWSSPVVITNNTITVNDNITIGAVYKTASNLSEFDITLTPATGLSVTFNKSGDKDWGDGTTDDTTTHTYSAYGNYTIKCDADTFPQYLFGQSSNDRNYFFTAVRFANSVVELKNNIFSYCGALKTVVIPNGVTTIGTGAFQYCYGLPCIITPSSVTALPKNFCISCYALRYVVIPYEVTSIGVSAFQYSYPSETINIPETVTSIGTSAFAQRYSSISAKIPNGVTTIPTNAFASNNASVKYDFTSHQAVPTLEDVNAFSGISGICKIKVPSSLEASWKTATNWVTYADYIEGV